MMIPTTIDLYQLTPEVRSLTTIVKAVEDAVRDLVEAASADAE